LSTVLLAHVAVCLQYVNNPRIHRSWISNVLLHYTL